MRQSVHHTHLHPGKNRTFFDNATNTTTGSPDMENSTWFMLGCILLATILILFFNTNYKRLEARPSTTSHHSPITRFAHPRHETHRSHASQAEFRADVATDPSEHGPARIN